GRPPAHALATSRFTGLAGNGGRPPARCHFFLRVRGAGPGSRNARTLTPRASASLTALLKDPPGRRAGGQRRRAGRADGRLAGVGTGAKEGSPRQPRPPRRRGAALSDPEPQSEGNAMTDGLWDGAERIQSYTRARAIRDGVLVDLSGSPP